MGQAMFWEPILKWNAKVLVLPVFHFALLLCADVADTWVAGETVRVGNHLRQLLI